MTNKKLEKEYQLDQSRWELYYNFENIVAYESDEKIRKYLNFFVSRDFLAMPIVFDLVNYKKINLLELLYKNHIPLTYQDDHGSNALHVACGAGGSLDCVKFFVENDILTDIDKKSTNFGDTPLTLAICYGHQDIVDFFKAKYKINSISLKDLDIILDRVISNQKRLTGRNFIGKQ